MAQQAKPMRRSGHAGTPALPGCQRTKNDRVILAAAPMSRVNLIVAGLDRKMQQASATTSGLRSGGVVRATRAQNSGQQDVSELTSALCTTADAEDGTPRKGTNLSGRRKAAAGTYGAKTGYAPPASSLDRRRVSFLVDGGKHSFDDDAQMYSQAATNKGDMQWTSSECAGSQTLVCTDSKPVGTLSSQMAISGKHKLETLRQSEISPGDDCRPRCFQNTILPGNYTLEEQSVYDALFQQLDANFQGGFDCITEPGLASGCLESLRLSTGLRTETLATVWQVANPDLKKSPCRGNGGHFAAWLDTARLCPKSALQHSPGHYGSAMDCFGRFYVSTVA